MLKPVISKFQLLLLLFLTSNILHAQPGTNDIFSIINAKQNPDNSITWWQGYIKPASLIDIGTGTIQIGTEKKLNSHFAVGFDYGLQFTALSYDQKGSDRKNYRYSKSNIEIKYFTGNKRNNPRTGLHYFSLRSFYFPQTYRLDDAFLILDSTSYHYDYSNVKRTVWTLTLISGHQFIKNKWMYNPYAGVGIRIINLQHHPYNLSPSWISSPVDWDFSSHIDREQGTHYRPNFAYGITVGYRLGN